MKAHGSVAIASAFVFSACSGGIDSKQDAAKALNRLMTASTTAQQSAVASGLRQELVLSDKVVIQGKSGTATVTFTSGAGAVSFDVAFSSFSSDGKNTIDGEESFALVNPGALSLAMTLMADVKMSGEFNANLKCDVKISVNAVSATMTIDGTVTADGKSFTFNNEEFGLDT